MVVVFDVHPETIAMDVFDFYVVILTQILSDFGDKHVHTSCCKVVVVFPDFGEGF